MANVFRLSRVQRLVCAAPLLFVVVVLASTAFEARLSTGQRSVGSFGAAVVLVVIVRFWFLRVIAMSEYVLVVNFVQRYRIPWDEVDRFVFDGGMSMRLGDLREVRVSAFSWPRGASPIIGRRAHGAVVELERLRRQAVDRMRADGGG
ncbi:hypothetical protein [Phycicoccus sp.]|uniref:hypothetical protein n=1 Tax=Phycicoccus sp. TaxID=1902410 RepID=UPI002C0B1D4D|nr:hypothetical protein [Phycicoccus sp.]HMM95241.1 hypothetical protein [Phycicoccus sp.]